jgi:hypothetical protein
LRSGSNTLYDACSPMDATPCALDDARVNLL